MRAARFRVAADLLARSLHMPPTAVIVGARIVAGGRAVEVTATDPALPDTAEPQPCAPSVARLRHGHAWDWNLG